MTTFLGPIPTTNYTSGRLGNTIRFVVLHHIAGTITGADARFHNPTSQVSAHYGVSRDGNVFRWVYDDDTAYQAGDYTANTESIGIEHEDDNADSYTAAEYAASAALVRSLCDRYSIPCERGHWPDRAGIIRHGEVIATACPGTLDVDRIIEEADMAFTPEDKAYLDAKVDVIVAALVDVARRQMKGGDPGVGIGNEPAIVKGEQINPSNAK